MKKERWTNISGTKSENKRGRKSIGPEIPNGRFKDEKKRGGWSRGGGARGWSARYEAFERTRAKRGYRSRTKDMHIESGTAGGGRRRMKEAAERKGGRKGE